jgi:hypothetical protein
MYKLAFKGKRAGWQFWSGRAWTWNSAHAAVMTEAEVEAFFKSSPNVDRMKIEKIEVK